MPFCCGIFCLSFVDFVVLGFSSSIEVEHHSTMPFFVGHFHLSIVDFVVLGFTFFIEHELHFFMQLSFILLN
jgi:hypothetical protein